MVDAVGLTQQLIRLDTVNPPGNEAEAGELIGHLLSAHGFDVQQHAFGPGRVNIVARRGQHVSGHHAKTGAPPICFTGHLDTVPLGSAPWKMAPFSADIVDGRLYGRGASDMKAGVAAIVIAAIETADEFDRGPGVVLVFTSGEETGCEGAAHLVKNADLGRVGAIVVGEPTSNVPRVGHKGALWLLAESFGRTAHGSMPELGVNAIFRSMKIVAKLQDFGFNLKPHDKLGSPTLNVGRMSGGINTNSVPDHAEIGIDIRTIPGMKHARLMNDFKEHLAPDLDRLTSITDLESVWTDPEHPWVQSVLRHLDAEAVHEPLSGLPFFTDASVLSPAFGNPPVLILGPGETAMAHQTDEYCEVEKISEAVLIYRRIMTEWQTFGAQQPQPAEAM